MNRFYLFVFVLLFSQMVQAQSRYIHVVVALCDNVNQGIVPVPKAIGNGQDPKNNLYWGCGYGVKTFMKKQGDWIFLKQINNPTDDIYERLVFKHKDSLVYLVADAYDGAEIKQTITDFFKYSSGQLKQELKTENDLILYGGNANLICYVGHDGLMEFSLDTFPEKSDEKKREVVILACASKSYFSELLQKTGAIPLVWTTNLMCPEAYTLDAIIDSWILHEAPSVTEEKAAQSYNEYQKCGIKGARNLFTTGY